MHERHSARCARTSVAVSWGRVPSASSASVSGSQCCPVLRSCPSFKPAAQLPDDPISRGVDASRSGESKLSGDLPRRPPSLETKLKQVALARLERPDHRSEPLRCHTGLTLHELVLGAEGSGILIEFVAH